VDRLAGVPRRPVLEMVVFAFVDPQQLHGLIERLEFSPGGVLPLAFFARSDRDDGLECTDRCWRARRSRSTAVRLIDARPSSCPGTASGQPGNV
jgi:hypothetical protein